MSTAQYGHYHAHTISLSRARLSFVLTSNVSPIPRLSQSQTRVISFCEIGALTGDAELSCTKNYC